MKMRKKLAALLAAAMIASVMPMTAFAASTNSVSKTVSFAKETPLVGNKAPTMKIELKHDLTTDEAFYIELTGAEWAPTADDANGTWGINLFGSHTLEDSDGNPLTGVSLNFNRTGSKFATVRVSGLIPAKSVIAIPLYTTLKGGEATVKIDGDSTAVTSQEFIFAKSSEGIESEVIVADPGNFSEKGGVSTITIREPFAGAYGSEFVTDDFIEFELELRDSDFKFVEKTHATDASKRTKIEGRRGFNFTDDSAATTPYVTVGTDTVKVKIPASQVIGKSQAGELVLSNISIEATRKATKGEVKATLRGLGRKDIIGGTKSIVIAKHTDFTTKLEMKKEYEVQTGKEVEVEFTLSEEISNSLLQNRAVTFELSGGAKFQGDFTEVVGTPPVLRYSMGNLTATAKDATDENADIARKSKVSKDDNYSVIEVSGFVPDSTKTAKYTFKTTILVPNNFEGKEVKLTAQGKALSDTHEIVAATVTEAVSAEVTPMDVKVGLKQQVGGKIVIKENAKEAVLRNYKDVHGNSSMSATNPATIDILIGDDYGWNRDGLRITDADIKVTEGDLVLDLDAKMFVDGYISIPVKRQSTEPSTIEITDIVVDADRTVPEGKYSIKIGGNALSKNTMLPEFLEDKALRSDSFTDNRGNAIEFLDPIAAEEFINITTKNTEDGAGRSGAEVVSFVIGNNKFIADGVEIEMDAAPYIKDGRTMVPLRYLATALGIDSESIKFNSGVVTIFKADGKVIQVTVGSKNLVVNGMSIPMVAAAEIIEGRTYVPVTEIGSVFDVTGTWDSATQTATFK